MIVRYKKYTFKQLDDAFYDLDGNYLGTWKLAYNGIEKYFRNINEIRDYLDILIFNEKLEILLRER